VQQRLTAFKVSNKFPGFLRWFCFTALAIIFLLNTLHLFKRDILYHTDVARDFLIMHDIVDVGRPPLIGPRSSVGGIFHGPAWFYLTLPVFIVFQENPVAMGVYWWLLFWAGLVVFYVLVKKMFSEPAALLATTLYAASTIFMPAALINWNPALFIIIACVYFIWVYLTKHKPIHLTLGLFLIGIVIQFEMAFGVPVLMMTMIPVLKFIFQKKLYRHLWAFLILALPLSTFVLFDLRHDWLQVRSALAFFRQHSEFNFWNYLFGRFQSLVDAFSLLKTDSFWLRTSAAALSIAALFLAKRFTSSKPKWRVLWQYTLLILVGFWLVTLPYKGNVWEFYYRNLLPLICLWAGFVVIKTKHILPTLLAVVIIGANVYQAAVAGLAYWQSPVDRHQVYWRFYELLANDLFQENNQAFGYYVFTTDQYGYQAKFALQYQNRFFQREMHENTKLLVTYLIIGPNDQRNPWANENYWRKEQVKIDRPADSIRVYEAGYTVEKYLLTAEELQVPSDPNLITGTYFR
jgi:hypothetical protein